MEVTKFCQREDHSTSNFGASWISMIAMGSTWSASIKCDYLIWLQEFLRMETSP
jgi:hypothetical protein